MMRYNVRVRLGGLIANQVDKPDVSAAEVIVLRAIHGSDAVVILNPIGNDKTPHRQERDRLDHRYGPALSKLKPSQSMATLFGPEHAKLPGHVDVDPVESDEAVAA